MIWFYELHIRKQDYNQRMYTQILSANLYCYFTIQKLAI